MAGMIKRFASAGADLLEEFYGKTQKQRLADASERATYDPVDGGLGLAPGNTSEERMQLMFPTRVFHGGVGRQASSEQARQLGSKNPETYMFVSDDGSVASSYAPAATDFATPSLDLSAPPVTKGGNVMPLRIDDSDAAVIDFEGRLFSGFRTDTTPDGVGMLNDAMLTDVQGTPKLQLRSELQDGRRHTMAYLPDDEALNYNFDIGAPFSTDELHSYSGHGMKRAYGSKPSMTRFDNIIDIGRHRHGETKRERYIPSTVFAIRDGSKVRSDFAAFDPLLRKYSGLSLGASAAAVGSLLDQLPTDEEKQGALYADGQR